MTDAYLRPCEACGFQADNMTTRRNPRRHGGDLRVCQSCAERIDAMSPPPPTAAEQAPPPGPGYPTPCAACGFASEWLPLTLRPDPVLPGAHISVCLRCADRLDQLPPPARAEPTIDQLTIPELKARLRQELADLSAAHAAVPEGA